ncbi:MAG: helix-turn-helix domain-containing protein, partial [Oliverpabstia sp.]
IVDMLEIMVGRMEEAYVVAKAYDGETALKCFLEQLPDIVLCDIRMPKKDGLELLKEMKEFRPDMHAVLLSGYGDFEYARQAIKLQVHEYLLKPVVEEELQTALRSVIEKIWEKENVAEKLFGMKGTRRLEEENEFKHEALHLLENIDKNNFKKVQETLSILFVKMGKKGITVHTLSVIVEQIEYIFNINAQNLIKECGNLNNLYEHILQLIKQSKEAACELTAREVADLLEYQIRKNWRKEFDSRELAEKYGYNATYLANTFKQQKGMTPKQFLQKIRMEKAMEMMQEDDSLRIRTIAEMTGYSDQLYFSRIFKRYTGYSPEDYIKQIKKQKTTNENKNL